MSSAVWNLRKKLSNRTRRTLRNLANRVGVGSFLPPPDEERLQREMEREAQSEGIEQEVKEVEQFAHQLYNSEQAMRNLGQNQNIIKKFTQEDFKKWKTEMDKKGKKWESALKLFLKYRGTLEWVLAIKDQYNPLSYFTSPISTKYKAKYTNMARTALNKEKNFNVFTTYPPYNPSYNPPLYVAPPPTFTSPILQLGRGRRKTRRYSKRRSKSHRIKRVTR